MELPHGKSREQDSFRNPELVKNYRTNLKYAGTDVSPGVP